MQFELKVVSSRQEISSLLLDTSTAEEAGQQAKRQGYVVLSVKESQPSANHLIHRRSGFPLLLFSHELLSLLDAGLSLIEAMETLREKESRPQSRAVLNQLMGFLYEGLPLSGALQKAPNVFPPLYIALVRSSEKTGDLSKALKRYVEYQLQMDSVRNKIISASIYPAILIFVGGLVIFFLMLYVVPKFSAIYENKAEHLPWLSQWLLAWGRMLHAHGAMVLSGFLALLLLGGYALTSDIVRQNLLKLFWQIPALGERMRIYQLARFYRTLGMLLRGGIPVVTAINMVAGLLQPGLQAMLALAEQDIREGVAISAAMENRELTTPIAVRMLRVGERSGRMGEMMERTGNFYDDEVARWVDWFTRLFEPILMTGMASWAVCSGVSGISLRASFMR